jgi:hypothetical protein
MTVLQPGGSVFLLVSALSGKPHQGLLSKWQKRDQGNR